MGVGSRRRLQSWVALTLLVLASGCSPPTTDPRPGPRAVSGANVEPRLPCGLTPEELTIVRNGYFPGRSGEVQIVPKEPNYLGAYRSHSGPWGYLQEVPLFLYGPGRVPAQGKVRGSATLADIAPTLAEHLRFGLPTADGGPLSAAAPAAPTGPLPRMVGVVVWDGLGRNVLARYPDAWPNLRSMIPHGAWFEDAVVGTSPSVTGAVHATLGTGAFPASHGRVANRFRFGGSMVGVGQVSPGDLQRPSLADRWDRAYGNDALVAVLGLRQWHIGMAGHGAGFPGGDHDLAVLFNEDTGRPILPAHDRTAFAFPPYVRSVGGFSMELRDLDLADGEVDMLWRGEDLADPRVAMSSPAFVRWQTRVLRQIILKEGFGADGVTDLLFTNYKQADMVGHRWGMQNRRMEEIVRAVDAELGNLVKLFDAVAGPGDWVLVLTADHGSAPPPEETGAIVIDEFRLEEAIRTSFDTDVDGTSVLLALSPSQAWLNREEMADEGLTARDVAAFIAGYTTEDNVAAPDTLPEWRRGERVFAGVFPSQLLRAPGCRGL